MPPVNQPSPETSNVQPPEAIIESDLVNVVEVINKPKYDRRSVLRPFSKRKSIGQIFTGDAVNDSVYEDNNKLRKLPEGYEYIPDENGNFNGVYRLSAEAKVKQLEEKAETQRIMLEEMKRGLTRMDETISNLKKIVLENKPRPRVDGVRAPETSTPILVNSDVIDIQPKQEDIVTSEQVLQTESPIISTATQEVPPSPEVNDTVSVQTKSKVNLWGSIGLE